MASYDQYPPPGIDRLLKETKVDADALKPSYEQMAYMARRLGTMILEDCAPAMPNEVFEVLCVVPRGGFFVNDVLSHAFGFQAERLQVVGTSGYEKDGITKSKGTRFTQLPAPEHIAGKHVLIAEDVCDTGHTLNDAKKLLLSDRFKALKVTTAALFYKPDKSETDFVPDYYVAETDKWVVFPGEVYEQLGPQSLNRSLWLPDSASTE